MYGIYDPDGYAYRYHQRTQERLAQEARARAERAAEAARKAAEAARAAAQRRQTQIAEALADIEKATGDDGVVSIGGRTYRKRNLVVQLKPRRTQQAIVQGHAILTPGAWSPKVAVDGFSSLSISKSRWARPANDVEISQMIRDAATLQNREHSL